MNTLYFAILYHLRLFSNYLTTKNVIILTPSIIALPGFPRSSGESSRPSRVSSLCSQASSESAPGCCLGFTTISPPVKCTGKSTVTFSSLQHAESRNLTSATTFVTHSTLVVPPQFSPETNIPGGWDVRAGVGRVSASGGLGAVGWGHRGQAVLRRHSDGAGQGAHLWWVALYAQSSDETWWFCHLPVKTCNRRQK